MGENNLRLLFDAEKKAKDRISKAHKRAEATLKNAEIQARNERDKRVKEFMTERDIKIEQTEKLSIQESERIRNEGLALAEKLKQESRQRIPDSVEKVMQYIREI